MFARCFRLNHTLTQYLIIFGSLVLFFSFYYFDGHHQLMKSSMADAIDEWINHEPIDKQSSPTTTTGDSAASAATSFRSTCSAAADRRGPNQNVIGYSMYGRNFSEPKFYNLYLKSFSETLKTIPIKYPGA
jgi:hypothetical protein